MVIRKNRKKIIKKRNKRHERYIATRRRRTPNESALASTSRVRVCVCEARRCADLVATVSGRGCFFFPRVCIFSY